MLSLGLDIASNSGWSILNEKKELVEFGSIQINSQMTLSQKLIFLGHELERIFNKNKITYVFIEDLICGISGVKTLSYLARLNGVAIYVSSKFVNNNIYLYNPAAWKKNSFENLTGSSKKYDVQLEVVKYYKLKFNMSEKEYQQLILFRQEKYNEILSKKNEIEQLDLISNNYKKELISKRTPVEEMGKKILNKKINDVKVDLDKKRKELKLFEKQIDKDMNKLSLQITSLTGIDQNISDSIAINFCGLKEVLK